MVVLRVSLGVAAVMMLTLAELPLRSAPSADDSIDNLRAFARLYGYVRYFHPSDEASRMDWEAFAVYGAARVDRPMDSEELRRTLDALFGPIAPSVQIFREGETPPRLDPAPPHASGSQVIAWQHVGPHYSTRTGRPRAPVDVSGWHTADVVQRVDAVPLRGRVVRLAGALRTERPVLLGDVDIGISVLTNDGKESMRHGLVEEGTRGVRPGAWERHGRTLRVPDDAYELALHLVVSDAVERAWFDDVSLVVLDGATESIVQIGNPSFEDGDSLSGWTLATGEWRFDPVVTGDESAAGENSLLLRPRILDADQWAQWAYDARPEPGAYGDYPLGRGLVARIPHALYGDDDSTWPEGDPARLASLLDEVRALGADTLQWDTRALRLGVVVSMWSALQHFYPYFDVVDVDWDRELTRALERARTDSSEKAFLSTLNRLLAALQDGHATAWNRIPAGRQLYFGPFMIERAGEDVVVTGIADTTDLRLGDVIVSVSGEPIADYLERQMAERSGTRARAFMGAMGTIMRGDYGSETALEVRRGDRTVPVRFRHVHEWLERPTGRPKNFTELAPGILYLYLWRTTDEDVAAHVDQLKAARGLVLDMRGYSWTLKVLGHLADSTMTSPRWERDRLIYPDRRAAVPDTSGRWTIEPRQPRFTSNVAFLIDARAMSSGETFLGFVEHYRLGALIGRPTAGTNGNGVRTHLPGGISYAWTGMRVRKQDGSRHHLVGIRPTHPVERTAEAIRQGRDEDIERALEVLGAR